MVTVKILKIERCVCCGKTMSCSQSLNIHQREHYIEGCGQLCRDCYFKLYIRPDPSGLSKISNEGLKILLALSRK